MKADASAAEVDSRSMPTSPARRIALVHDFLLDLRGAERVFLALCDIYPDADIFTSVYDPVGTEGRFAGRRIHTSFLQRLRPDARSFRRYLPLYPHAMEAFDLSGYQLVISSSSAWAHGVIPQPGAVHVCYCHNPFRYAWNARHTTLAELPAALRPPLALVFSRWRRWDWLSAQRVDAYIANSETTRQRIASYFGREAEVINPPVAVKRFAGGAEIPASKRDGYLVLSELMGHKRIELAVKAFSELKLPLTVVGDGPAARRLKMLAGPTVKFTGRVADDEVVRLLHHTQALVVTATEEFGIAAIEAQAAGRPVIAYGQGGVRETIKAGQTGIFYDEPTVPSLSAAIAALGPLAIDPQACVANADRFDSATFKRRIVEVVERVCVTSRQQSGIAAVRERRGVSGGLVRSRRRVVGSGDRGEVIRP